MGWMLFGTTTQTKKLATSNRSSENVCFDYALFLYETESEKKCHDIYQTFLPMNNIFTILRLTCSPISSARINTLIVFRIEFTPMYFILQTRSLYIYSLSRTRSRSLCIVVYYFPHNAKQ